MVRDSNEGRTEKHERSPWLRPAMLGSMKARPRAASADVTLASSSIHGAEYVPLSPCPYNAAVLKGPAFSFLNYCSKPTCVRNSNS